MNLSVLSVARFLPRSDFAPYLGYVIDSSVETLTVHDADLDLCHVQPTRMFGRVMEFKLFQDAPRLGWGKGFVQARSGVRVQVVQHQTDLFGLRIMHVHQFANALGPVFLGASVGHYHVPPTGLRFAENKLAA